MTKTKCSTCGESNWIYFNARDKPLSTPICGHCAAYMDKKDDR